MKMKWKRNHRNNLNKEMTDGSKLYYKEENLDNQFLGKENTTPLLN